MNRTQKRNLARLTLFCWENRRKLQKHFAMSSFARSKGKIFGDQTSDFVRTIDLNTCGTSACFCGCGPQAGIRPKKWESWNDYGARVFGANGDKSDEIWNWLFDSFHESRVSNACRRAAWVLEGKELLKYHFIEEVDDLIKGFRPNWALIKKLAQ